MTRAEFLSKYPKPWKIEEDRLGNAAVWSANDQLLVHLGVDVDWPEGIPDDGDPEDQSYRPVFNGAVPVMEGGEDNEESRREEEEREALLDILLGANWRR